MSRRTSRPLEERTERAKAVRSVSSGMSGGASTPLTFLNFTLFISVRNASIFSVGILTVGCAVRVLLTVRGAFAALMGASTGGPCFLSAARAETRNDSVAAVVKGPDLFRILETVNGVIKVRRGGGSGGGGGGGGGGGVGPEPLR